MRSKYGAPGQTDQEGFDPYADRVGPGIYGGHVKRDECGRVIYGEQYQNHNPRPGPVYAGGGYTPIVQALGLGHEALEELLDACPEAVNEVTTGGATPLHMAGMSKRNQEGTEILIRRGGNMYVRREEGGREGKGRQSQNTHIHIHPHMCIRIQQTYTHFSEAVDTYGYRPLHRMASNNLAVGAKTLLDAGADPKAIAGTDDEDGGRRDRGETPMAVARSAGAWDVVQLLLPYYSSSSS